MLAKLVWNCASDRVAGPLVTDPLVVYCDPWQGHSNVPLPKLLTTHCSCVQTAVRAVNWSPARETRKLPLVELTSAAPPVAASGEFASIVTVTVPLDTVPLTVRSAGRDELLGDVELPPHPVIAEATAASDTA